MPLFDQSGPVGLFPEEELAKCLSDFCLDLANNGKLALVRIRERRQIRVRES